MARLDVFGESRVGRGIRDGRVERRWALRHGVAERDDLLGALDGADVLRKGGGARVDDEHGVEPHALGNGWHLVGRAEPDGREHARQVRDVELELLGAHARARLEQRAQASRLFGPVDEPDLPGFGESAGEQLTGRGRVRFVDEPEVGLEPVDDLGVGAEERLVGREGVLERRLPPGEFKLGRDLLGGHVSVGQVGQQRREALFAQLGDERRALLQVVHHG